VTTPPPAYGPPPGSYGQPPNPAAQANPYGYAVAPPPGKRPVRTWDLVVTIILLVLDGVLAAIMSFFGFFLAMAGDSCGARDCNSELIAIGLMVAVALPWLVLILVAIVSIVLLVTRRLAFWVPLVGAALIIASWPIGALIASAGVPGAL
jgi:uncharacterized BrkB/YihY/UPF0761 family membrane protein